jgi:hypothetical protein
VWYVNYKGQDGFVSADDGKIASSVTEQQMRAFCLANSIPIMTETPEVCDFDSIAAWCEHPAAETIDPVTFLRALSILEDAGNLKLDVENPDDKAVGRMDKVYDKLFYANNFPAVPPLAPVMSRSGYRKKSVCYPVYKAPALQSFVPAFIASIDGSKFKQIVSSMG